MTNPVIHAFFLGRAIAEVIGEQLEDAFTNALSELGKFDAEQRENLRQFVEEVQMRADQAIDEMRAEIAQLRSELKNYQN
ncbi:MAG: hypothetical protein EWV82_02105 [Microcystis aeruginosa Ma_AC_P_19900807_S299]|nr:MAG: hypothetical protein EWV82_02105 [Microcystis aeruginosa Ma_AC_P_19900807_S299]